MKFRLLAFVLALSVSMWAQTATQAAPAQSTPASPKEQCACCDKAAAESGSGCCHHTKGKDEKETAGCCGGKEGSCCGKGMQCGKESAKNGSCCGDTANGADGKSCCGKSADGEKTAMNCCKDKQCKRHPMSGPSSPGN